MISQIATLNARFQEAVKAAYGLDDVDPLLVEATRPEFGDFQYNAALGLAKKVGAPPRAVAQDIVAQIRLDDLCETPSVAGPGFINLKLKTSVLEDALGAVEPDDRLGVPRGAGDRVVVDFSSPNIAKEMHVGHLRSTIIGDSIARILDFLGRDVLRINHVGDWGTQFGMLIGYLREAYPAALTTENALDLGDLVALYKKAKARFDEDEEFAEYARFEVVKLQTGDPDSLNAWKMLCSQSRRAFEEIYDLLDVKLTERGESFYNPYLSGVVTDLDGARLLKESDGALCVFVDGFLNKDGDPLPLIVQKSDGAYNYATTDLAAIRYRIGVDQARTLVYVTDAGQRDHFAQCFAVARLAGWATPDIDLVHVPFGLVLGPDGRKLKTRSGETVKLRDLLDEAVVRARELLDSRLAEEGREETAEWRAETSRTVGIAAVKYADLSQNRASDYAFSFDKMLALQGNTAPYMLYANVRVQGIHRKGGESGQSTGAPVRFVLTEPQERVLARHLLQLDEILAKIAVDYLPNRLCQYLFELSQKFNQFYENCPVLTSEDELRTSRVALCNLTARTLSLGLSLLGIKTVDRL
ncbi:MAG: arginine--tRNA ligase [Capsulimonadaceae bacterium]